VVSGFETVTVYQQQVFVGARVEVDSLLAKLLAKSADSYSVPGASETFLRLSEMCGDVVLDANKSSQKALSFLIHNQAAKAWKQGVVLKASSISESVKIREERRILLVSRPHSGSWLHAYPSKAFSLGMQSEVFVAAVKYWLGHELFTFGVPSGCLCCDSMDSFGDFSQSCRFFGLLIRRHNLVRDTLASLGWKAKVSPKLEALVDGRKAADVLLCGFDSGSYRDVAVDVTVRNPFRIGGDISVAESAEIAKNDLHSAHCNAAGVAFAAFGLDTWGGWGPSAFSLINRLARRAVSNGNQLERSWMVSNFRKSISVAVMVGVGESLLHHCGLWIFEDEDRSCLVV
jgi:hypothetical protein